MDIRKLEYMELANRYLAINSLVNFYDPLEIEKINPQMVEYIEVNKNGTWIEIPQIDILYCLFKAPTAEFTQMMKELARKDQEKLDSLSLEEIESGVRAIDKVVPLLKASPKANERLTELINNAKETLRRKTLRDSKAKEKEEQMTKAQELGIEIVDSIPKGDITVTDTELENVEYPPLKIVH